jgi:hypothetical protein
MFDMTTQEFFKDIPLSNYRVGYFKVLGWEEGKPKDITDISKAVVLEICLIPEHNAINQLNDSEDPNVLLTVPSGSKIIRVKAGDYWPFLSDMKPLEEMLREGRKKNEESEDFWTAPELDYDEKF